MGKVTLDRLCQWVKDAEPKVDDVGKDLVQLRNEIRKLGEALGDLLNQQAKLESSISGIQSQIAQLQSQASSSDDDDDDGASAAIESQISALQGRLGEYQSLLAEVIDAIDKTRKEIEDKQEDASVCISKLGESDETFALVSDGFTAHLRENIQTKETLSRAGSIRFASASAAEQISIIQRRINTCMSFQRKISEIRGRIQQYLGDERDQREKVKTLSRSH